MLCELGRGHAAFERPAAGFTVVPVTLAKPTVVSVLLPENTWVLAAVRNLGPTAVDAVWSCANISSCNFCTAKTAVGGWPALPVPPFANRFALPACRGVCPGNALQYHDLWLHAAGSLELLAAERDPQDATPLYSIYAPGLAVLEDGRALWRSGMMTAATDPWRPWVLTDWELIRKAVWAATQRVDEPAPALGAELLLGRNEASRTDPGAHWTALREWGARFAGRELFDVTPEERRQWNARFAQYGSGWMVAPRFALSEQEQQEYALARARADGWWIATDLRLLLERAAARKLQRAFKRSLADPGYLVCRRRLLREHASLAGEDRRVRPPQ